MHVDANIEFIWNEPLFFRSTKYIMSESSDFLTFVIDDFMF